MIAKVLMTGLGIALSWMLVNKIAKTEARAPARAKDASRPPAKLRQDPQTGIYYPEE